MIVGLGATGVSVARYLPRAASRVRVIDSRAAPPGLAELKAACPDAEVIVGTLDPRWLDDASRVLLSPGLAYDIPLALEARRRGLAVIGDIELFALAARAPVVAVTGTNGKSTVTTLCRAMLEAQGLRAPAGGNLGQPALDLLDARSRCVRARAVELPAGDRRQSGAVAAAVLNVSADHLDRYGTLERYAELKEKLLRSADTRS